MKATRYLLSFILALTTLHVAEATDYIRYVSKDQGAYNNDGTSWSKSKINVQDAINDIKDKLEPGDRGYIFVQEGLYRPTQAVGGSTGSTLYMSIQIPGGISVYGGFKGDEEGTAREIIAQRETVQTAIGSYMKNQTIFCGSLSSTYATYEWNEKKSRYNTSYFGNCYHVVWFATNGSTTDENGVKHYNALADSAVLDGVVIRDGYAYNSDINLVEHNAFGGGAYMVDGAIVRNCEIFHCEASRSGGGLYLDRGGLVENCYVHDCQSLGVNSVTGFGGGVAVDQKGLVSHCAIINNVGRSGGGLSLNYDLNVPGYNQYGLASAACLIAQNTSTVEAGGLYLNQGGLVNGVTIVNNKTFGTGVTLNGVVTGRSGGVYVRNHARIYNSVLWGNETETNKKISLQYAATRSSADNSLKPLLTYVALSRADYTDWSGTKKVGLSKLADDNENSSSTSSVIKYPMFDKPCTVVGHIDDQADIKMTSANSYVNVQKYHWQPTPSSGLCYAGLQLLDIHADASSNLSAGFIYKDLENIEFSPKCALGAYATNAETIVGTTVDGIFTLFVDPNRASGKDYLEAGKSWDSPLDNLTDALLYMKQHNRSGQVLVKEGTLYPASRFSQGRLRGTSVPMVSNVVVKGGYPSVLTATNQEQTIDAVTYKRNPVVYPTIISGKISHNDYASNVAHLVAFDGVTNSTLDGFELRWGNAASTAIQDFGQNGSGIWVKNNAVATLKNLTVSDCTASMGSALYAESGSVDAENCIFRNNESILRDGGILKVAANANVTLDHCNVIRNVGYAVSNNGNFTTYNTLYYSNMNNPVEDTNGKGDKAFPAFFGQGQFVGEYNLFDQASLADFNHIPAMGLATMDWTFTTSSTTYPRFVNSTKNAGISEFGDVTYYGRAVDYTPSDMNPAVNAASTNNVVHTSGLSSDCWGKDMTTLANRDFGGLPDVGALENGAYSSNSATQPAYGTKFYVRDYHTYDSEGNCTAVDFSTTHADGSRRDGYSWNNAINGNAMYDYTYNNVTKPINGLQYAVNTMHDNLGLPATPRKVQKNENGQNNTLSYYDLPAGRTDGEVWVGVGVYTKPEGFVMRNHVKVLGGFPKVGNPGLQERHPQLSSGITMSDENIHLDLDYRDYETILQTNFSPQEKLINELRSNSYVPLSNDMFHSWNNVNAEATVTGSPAVTNNIGNGTTQNQGETMYGNGWVNYLQYADLSAYKTMIIEGSGQCRLLFNRQGDESPLFKQVVLDLNGHAELDLTNLVSVGDPIADNANVGLDSYVHLNAIKVPYGNSSCKIDGIFLVPKSVGESSNVVTNELTDFSMDLDDKTFIVTAMDGESIFYFHNSNSNQDVKLGRFSDLKNSADNYYFMRFTRVTDYTNYQYEGDVYSIQLFNVNGNRFVASNIGTDSDREGFFNAQVDGEKLFAIGLKKQYGQDGVNLALWRIGHDGKGFYIQNVERARNGKSSYVSPLYASPQSNRVYVRLFAQGVSVLCHPGECRPTNNPDVNIYESRTIYEGTEWDGFTIRNGFKLGVVCRGSNGGRRNSGAGVSMFENAKITNCVVRQNNIAGNSAIGRGAGVYCDGGSIINCYVMDNVANCKHNTSENFGGGIYMITGTLYNTVIAHNDIKPATGSCHGAGIFMESASFYNNTIVDNTGGSAIGVYTSSTTEEARLTVYNTIVIAAPGQDILWRASENTPTTFDHCYLQHTVGEIQNGMNNNVGITDCIFGYADQNKWDQFGPFVKTYSQADADYDYRITTVNKGQASDDPTKNNNCVNAGTENIGLDYLQRPAVLPANDMDWTDRIQDCRVDIGAYEFNGAGRIMPDEETERTGSEDVKIYYVTELGFGTTQANDPANAACAQKLQKVLDAAGRYKSANPDSRVIVKLAGVDATADGYNESDCFKYYPCRTTDEQDDNVRVWSIMVPHGVEVWGGYSVEEVLNETTNEAIAPCFTDDERSVMYHPTFLQTEYNNSDLNEKIKGYHVVTFTDRIFDKNGVPYLKGDEIGDDNLSSFNAEANYTEEDFRHLSDYTVDRAVLDGLFLVGGQADGESNGSTAAVQNINQYGGAAIVTDFAHVRNCIVKNNTATYGGALALMGNGLVSGSLIIDNTAEFGGGIYILEDAVQLSDGSVNSTTPGSGALDANMSHIYTTTVVKNTGNQQGGGLWFSNDADLPNVRVNSTVLWQNESPDQANVAGQTSPDMPDGSQYSTFEWYPLAYSAVQNLRVSGTSNISVDIQNKNGNRFGKDSDTNPDIYTGKVIAVDTTEINYYGLTVFSALCRTGMPWSNYEELVRTLGLATSDYNMWSRDTIPAGSKSRSYVDIGARAYPSSPALDLEHPFLRLFVAETQDVNMDAYETMQNFAMQAEPTDPNYIYGLLGSSFAFPFQNLDDALAYIAELRKSDKWRDKASNMPFEICIARGEYYPQRDMEGNYGYSLANTYLIPEGVTLMGGFDCNDMYGQYLRPDSLKEAQAYTSVLVDNVVRFSNDQTNYVGLSDDAKVAILQLPLDTLAERRVLEDLNLNDILEPWEFRNQTNLSGNTVNLQNSGVYHVVSVIPYAPGVGQLPLPAQTNADYVDNGQMSKYIGQPVVIDGVHISDGYARDYVDESLQDNGVYDYYRGAGIRANGNWICESIEADANLDVVKHQDKKSSVAYRDIPLYIRNSQFINNQAGYGAAIDANVSTYIYNCLFAENKAMSKTENVNWKEPHKSVEHKTTLKYAGNGGAIYFTKHLEAYNTIFSNNEAQDASAEQKNALNYADYNDLITPSDAVKEFGGAGGAICGGYYSYMKILNCDIVNNKANIYPAIFTMNPGSASATGESTYNMIANNVFWGNAINKKVNPNDYAFARNLCVNYRKNSVSGTYDISLANAPVDQDDLDNNFVEAVWFSGYELGRGKTTNNSYDMREFRYDPSEHITTTLRNYWETNYSEAGVAYPVLNANITLSSVNGSIEGPNFCNPSIEAGYDGYSEAADWSRARLNNLTDNGSCMLRQNVVNNGADGYSYSWNTTNDGLDGTGIYYTSHYMNKENELSMDLGDDHYMSLITSDTEVNMPRVAIDPSPTRTKAYIDLGVYEYPHTKLQPASIGDDVDILWVSTIEKSENGTPDGSVWERPTSDLQRAIETLMSSRNSHRKEIRLMDGEYAPIYTHNDYKAFYLNTEELNNSVVFPDWAYDEGMLKYYESDIQNYYVRSLTLKGGYSKDLRDQYDTELYPAVIRSSERLDGTSHTWDYLFLIEDATQRYGKGDIASSGYGATANPDDPVTRTIPVEFDGITFVNNQALPGTHGAAIRYNDQVNTYDVDGTLHTDYANAPAHANISISKQKYYELKNSGDEKAVLSAKCTYWTDETYTTQLPAGQTSDFVLYYQTIQNPPKLTISKSCVMNSGSHYDASTKEDYSSSAVYIGQYGGDALIYNSVFHSNWGNPLEAYNTRTINNTIALNHGRWILMNSGSIDDLFESGSTEGKPDGPMLAPRRAGGVVHEMTTTPRHSNIMNTVLWRNNPVTSGGTTTYGSQFSLAGYYADDHVASDSIFKRNAYTYYNNGVQDVTEGTDYDQPSFVANHRNTHISNTNNDISHGPNFKNPILNATDKEIESRDFSLQPSIRLVNKGDSMIYANQVYDFAWIPTTELDYLDQKRVMSTNIEVGAIEYQQPLLRVIYVDPTQAANSNGMSWASSMNSENLQNAIDLAAIYSANNEPLLDASGNVIDKNESYVFVKGDNETVFPSVTLRNGVNIYGSVDPNNVVDSVRYKINELTGDYIYEHLQEDVDRIANHRPGLVSPSTERTIIPAVSTGENDTYSTNKPTRIDGVMISAVSTDNADGAVLKPVLDIDPKATVEQSGSIPAVAVSNVLVADNNASAATDEVNIANINNALIYEVLFRDNVTSAQGYVLNLGATGYGVNLTVEGKTNDAAGKEPKAAACLTDNLNGGHIWYSIYNYAGFDRDEQTLSKHNYKMQDPNLNYQLTEHSLNLDACATVNPMTLDAKTTNLVQFINYDKDLDLLGNPRVLNTASAKSGNTVLDRGAFETWCIGNDVTAQTVFSDTVSTNYGGNYYPHEGSVVYLLEGSNLIAEKHSLYPGYLLVKKGASLYGHGQTIKASFLAVERDVDHNGTVIALPYRMNYSSVRNAGENSLIGPATYAYNKDTQVLTLTADMATLAYSYNGSRRASARYQIKNVNSGCWDDLRNAADQTVEASKGVFFTCSKDTTYRFTAQGVTIKNYLYNEQPQTTAEGVLISTAKAVTLRQNNLQPTDGNGNLTAAEDMGWNCFGIPYLVSEYKPFDKAYDVTYNRTASAQEYMLQLPKNLWLYYDAAVVKDLASNNWTAQNAKNYAGFYAVESWKGSAADWHLQEGSPALWVGEGMFAQTAAYTDEELFFYLPIYKGDTHAAPARNLTRVYAGEPIEEELDKSDALENTIYDLQGHKVQNPTQHGIYIVNGKRVWM